MTKLIISNYTGIVGLFLAAGKSQRFGSNKLLHNLDDEPIAAIAARNLISVLPNSIAVIKQGDRKTRAILEHEGLIVLECANAESGMGYSLAFGIHNSWNAKGWVISLADMPFICEQTIRKVATAIKDEACIAVPVLNKNLGHPVGFSQHYRNELSSLNSDNGARSVIENNQNALLKIEVDDPGIHMDIDSPVQIEKYLNRKSNT